MPKRGINVAVLSIWKVVLVILTFTIIMSLISAQSAQLVTLSASKSSAIAGEKLDISWNVEGITDKNDYIAIVQSGKQFIPGNPSNPFVSTDGTAAGTKQLKVPPNFSSIQIIYYSAASKQEIGRSLEIKVSLSSAIVVSSKSSALAGEQLDISWTVNGVTNNNDFIALVPSGKQYIFGYYPFAQTDGIPSGTKKLAVPSGIDLIQIIYYSSASQKEIGRTDPIPVFLSRATLASSKSSAIAGEKLDISWNVEGIADKNDYVAIVQSGKQFIPGNPSNPFVSTDGTAAGTKQLKVPPDFSSIQIIYYSAASNIEVGRSDSITVSASSATLNPTRAQEAMPESKVQPIQTLFVTPHVNPENQVKYLSSGYIIELTEKPLVQKQEELKELAKENENKINSMSNLNPLKYVYEATLITSNDVPKKLRDHKNKIDSEQATVKENIKNRLGKKQISNSITGNAVSTGTDTLNVVNQYENVFNGLALRINDSEAKQIKTINMVKGVFPNLRVNATLMDSVPLIKANEVWLLDEDKNQCSATGKQCITGKNVRIGIIDTGVDYTHPDLGGCFGTKVKVEEKVLSSAATSTIKPIIGTANGNTYEIQLDIPSYLPEYLRHPTKIFSGRKIKIIKKTGNFAIGSLPKSVTISGSNMGDKTLAVDKASDNFFSLTIPPDTNSGAYSINFRDNGQILSIPVNIFGISQDEKNLNSQSTNISPIVPIKRLQCSYCYWEAVLAHNPKNEYEGFIAGASNNLHQTKDGWDTYQKLDINSITRNNIGYFNGDSKLTFDSRDRLNIAALGTNGSLPLNGVFYRSLTAGSYPVELEKTFLDKPPEDLPPEFSLIGDFPKIAVDIYNTSPYFDNIYLSVNAAVFKDNNTGQYQHGTALFIIKNLTIIKKKGENIGLIQPAMSGIVDSDGTLFFGRWDGLNDLKVFFSNNGGQSFQKNNLPIVSKPVGWCAARVSTKSPRGWLLYDGPELALGKNGRLFAAWSELKDCKDDPSFEYGRYAIDYDVFVSYSDDKGKSWSKPVRVNDDFSGGDQGFPSIAIDKDGVIYVVFADHRNNQDKGLIDFYLSFSIDNGQSFSKNFKLNDISVPIVYGGRVIGDYLDMVQAGPTKVFAMFPCVSLENPIPDFASDTCIVPINKPIKFEPQTPPQCSDNIDNDGDGLIDYPNDKGCDSQFDDNEIDETFINSTCKVVDGYDFVNNDNDPMDDMGHGTHVAAIAAGDGLLRGVAPDANIVAYKVLDSSGSGYFSNVIAAIERSVDPNQDGNLSDHLDIISMSLGATCWGYSNECGPEDSTSRAVDNAVKAGVIAVIAAGNSGPYPGTIGSPGTARDAITVGATDKNDNMAYFSSQGPVAWGNGEIIKPDVSAPGVNICAAEWDNAWSDRKCLDNAHISISGTSMATPHVSGAAALIKQAHPDWTPQAIKLGLRETAVKLSMLTPKGQQPVPINSQGYGRINVLNAVNLKYSPPIARINTSGSIKNGANIIGTANGFNFKSYSLYYGTGLDPIDWVQLYTSTVPVYEGIIYKNISTLTLSEGKNTLRLLVQSTDGQISEDRTILIVSNFRLTTPLANDVLRLGEIISMNGSIDLPGQFLLEYGKGESPTEWYSNGIKLENKGTGPIDGMLGTFDTSVVGESGFYTVRLTYNKNGIPAYKYISSIYLDSALRQGWPQRINWEQDYCPFSNAFSSSAKFYAAPMAIKNALNNNVTTGSLSVLSAGDLQQKIKSDSNGPGQCSIFPGVLEPVVSDLDHDGTSEIIVYKDGNPPKLMVYNYDGTLIWSKNVGNGTSGLSLSAPVVGDLDGDGFDDIIVNYYHGYWIGKNYRSDSKLYAFDRNGNQLNGFPVEVPRMFQPSMSMGDLKQDGNKEIIIKSSSGITEDPNQTGPYPPTLMIINATGAIVSKWDLPMIWWIRLLGPSAPSIGNFDDDPEMEVVDVQPSPNAGYDWKNNKWINEGIINVFKLNGSQANGWPQIVPGELFSSPAVGDINNDGKLDIIVGLEYASNIFPDWQYGGLYAFDSKGNILPGWPVEKGYNFESSPSLADFDGDGKLEIAASRLGFATYVFRYDGTIVQGWPQYTAWNDYYSTIIGDVNGDGVPDIITTAGNGFYHPWTSFPGGVYAWNFDGTLISGFPKVTEVDAQASATIADIDNDGKIELIASSDFDLNFVDGSWKKRGSIYVWNLNSAFDKSKMEWPTFHHDNQRTGLYSRLTTNTGKPNLDFKTGNFNTISFDELGNLILRGALTTSKGNLVYSDDSFIIRDANGSIVALMNLNKGNMMIKGQLFEKQTILNPPASANHFIVKNPDGIILSYMDDFGNLYLRGSLITNGNP